MKKFIYLFLSLLLLGLYSCKKDRYSNIVINELMAVNRTGILLDEDRPADWIELKNLGKDSVDLKNFKLIVKKHTGPDSLNTEKDNGDISDKESFKEWTFPSLKIGAGECLVVFAEKIKDNKAPGKVQADINLPKEGALLQLIAPDGSVISEVNYKELKPDQSLALQSDSTYMATFWQSPGFDNNREGYEEASKLIDSQRKDPLLIWEFMTRAPHSYENWVELKNTGNKPINLSDYSLSKKLGKKEESWNLPDKSLSPGEIICFQLAGGKANTNNPNQLPFKSGDTETVVLSKNGKFIDGLCGKLTQFQGSIGIKA